MNKTYRPNAGIVLFRADGKVLLCERIENYPKRWQFPQGGIDADETPLQAAVRELREETSVTSAKFIAALPDALLYDFPAEVIGRHPTRHFDGQKQYWHLFCFEGEEDEINLNTKEPEFRSYKWVDIKTTPDLVVEFKKDVYKKVTVVFSDIIERYLSPL